MSLRVSPSQINLFLNEPALWILSKFYNVKGEMGPAATRGTAIEKGLEAILTQGKSYEDALQWAYTVFDKDWTGKPEGDEERAFIEPMLKQAVELFLQLDGLKGTQIKLEGEIHGVGILGFADFDFDTFLADLKTTKRCPSCVENLSAEHLTQLAIYRILSGKEQRIAYVTDKKAQIFSPPDEQLKAVERRVMSAIKAMKTAWDMADTGVEKIAVLYPPRDMSSFYWDEQTRKHAYQIWN